MRIEPSPEFAPDLANPPSPPRCCLDLQGWIQAVAGLVIALIALLSSYDNVSLPAGAKLQLPQQWGVWFIAASVALVALDAQLATGSRLRAADETAEERNRAAVDEVGRRPWNETEQLRQENRRLAALQSRMDALLRNE